METGDSPMSQPAAELRRRIADASDDLARESLLAGLAQLERQADPDSAVARLCEAARIARADHGARRMSRHIIDAAETLRDHGRWEDALALLPFFDDAAEITDDVTQREVVLGQRAYVESEIEYGRCDHVRARRLAEEADNHWAVAGFTSGRQAAANMLGNIDILTGSLSNALVHQRRAMELARAAGDTGAVCASAYNLALTMQRMGRWEDAIVGLEALLTDVEVGREPALLAQVLALIGELELRRDRLESAESALRRAAALCRDTSPYDSPRLDVLSHLGEVCARQGRFDEARQLYKSGIRESEEVQDYLTRTDLLRCLAELELMAGDIGSARESCRMALEEARNHGLTTAEAMALGIDARLHVAAGDLPAADAAFRSASALVSDKEDSFELAWVRSAHGRYLIESGDHGRGRRLLREAERVFRKLHVVGEQLAVSRFLFEADRSSDPDSAVLEFVSGLAGLGLRRAVLCGEVLRSICRAWGFANGAVLDATGPLAVEDSPDLARADVLRAADDEYVGSDAVSWRLRCGDELIGTVYLERGPGVGGPYPLVMSAVTDLLAGAVRTASG
jgi:tetratricopeptide (TPR) repeat protein